MSVNVEDQTDLEYGEPRLPDESVVAKDLTDFIKERGLPKVNFRVEGKRILVLQLEGLRQVGRIIVPDAVGDRHVPTMGVVVQVGSGWEPHEPIEAQQDFQERCPFQAGDWVIWGRFQEKKINCTVDSSFLTDEELERQVKFSRPEQKSFVILETTAIWGKVLENPE